MNTPLITRGITRIGAGSFAALAFATFLYMPFSSREAEAQIPGPTPTVELPGPLLTGVAATAAAASATAIATGAYAAGTAPRDLLTSLLIITAKTAIDSLTQSIVNWINSGFQGSPAFITDLNRNLSNLGDAVANDFINGLNQVVMSNTGINIRAPFQDQIAAQLREEFYRTTSSYGFDLRHPYQNCYTAPATTVKVGTSTVTVAATTTATNFSISGFLCQSQNPNNNAYGRYQTARNELFKQLDGEAQRRLTELGWGRGFLPWRGTCGQFGNKVPTASSTPAVNLGTAETNRQCAVRTPGAVIEDQLTNVLGSGVRQLELADNFNEIISALVSQLLNQVLGSSGLSGASQPQTGGGQSLVNTLANSTVNVGSELFAQNIAGTQTQVTKYRELWQNLIAVARTASQACARDATKAAQANAVVTTATAREQEAGQVLTNLASIEADRVRITAAGTASTQLEAVTQRFAALINNLGAISADTTGTATQMEALAASCR